MTTGGIIKKLISTAAAAVTMSIISIVSASAANGSAAWGTAMPEYKEIVTIDVTEEDYEADPTGSKDSADSIQKALDEAKDQKDDVCTEIKIPKGTYTISYGLRIYSNTRLIVSDEAKIIKCYDNGAMLSTASMSAYGYDGVHNVLVQGGTWDGNVENYNGMYTFSNIRVAHASNITFRSMNIINNKNGHHIEAGGVQGLTIEGCSFSGFYGGLLKEAIQLDVMNSEEVFGGYAPFDDTACDNVVIRNCSFSGIPRGIGSHSAVAGVYYTNVTITGNKFSDISDICLMLYNYKYCTISDNTMTDCGAGITFNYMTDETFRHYFPSVNGTGWSAGRIDGNADTVIKDNTISTVQTTLRSASFGIKFYGVSTQATNNYPSANYYISNIDVKGNKINSSYSGLILNNVYNAQVEGNEISSNGGEAGYLLYANYCFSSEIKSNSISGSLKSGICAENCSEVKTEENTLSNNTDVGVLINASSDMQISKNNFSGGGLGGVKIASGSESVTCTSNIVNGGGVGYAIKVDESGSGKDIKIKSNDIKDIETGISCTNGGKAYMVGNSFEAVGVKVSADDKKLVTLAKPRNFNAEEITSDNIKLTWTSVGEADGINVYRKRAGTEDFELIAAVDSGSIFQDSMLIPGTNYIYKVVPYIMVKEKPSENTGSDDIAARTKINIDTAQIDCVSEAAFTGKAVTPELSLELGSRKLTPGVDYDYKYENNIYAGTANISISGKGNYIGTVSYSYQIKIGAPLVNNVVSRPSGAMMSSARRRYKVTLTPAPTQIIADGSHKTPAAQRLIDSIMIQAPYKVNMSEIQYSY